MCRDERREGGDVSEVRARGDDRSAQDGDQRIPARVHGEVRQEGGLSSATGGPARGARSASVTDRSDACVHRHCARRAPVHGGCRRTPRVAVRG